MKPIVIIAIAVVCSVVAMFGVLVGYEMYQAYQIEKGLAFGVDVQKENEWYLRQIVECIPNKSACFTQIKSDFRSDFNTIVKKHGFDPRDPDIMSYGNMATNYLQIEYDYQNEIYDIQYSDYNSYSADNLVFAWEQAYERAVAQTQIEVGERDQKSESVLFLENEEALTQCSGSENLIFCLSKYNSGIGVQETLSSSNYKTVKPKCPSTEHVLVEYDYNNKYRHFADKNGNGMYCEYIPKNGGQSVFFDDV